MKLFNLASLKHMFRDEAAYLEFKEILRNGCVVHLGEKESGIVAIPNKMIHQIIIGQIVLETEQVLIFDD